MSNGDGGRGLPSSSSGEILHSTMNDNTNASSGAPNGGVVPRKLELILSEEDGSLKTSSLLNVILATTDSLYNDIHNMANGEVLTHGRAAQATWGAQDAQDGPSDATTTQTLAPTASKKKMKDLAYDERRHEASWSLVSHQRAVSHVAALHASAFMPHNNINNMGRGRLPPSGSPSPASRYSSTLGRVTSVSTNALQHARKAWVSADEAQDSLYFSHANLFLARAPPHDIYGACDTMVGPNYRNGKDQGRKRPLEKSIGEMNESGTVGGQWYDLPSDLRLVTDRYNASEEQSMSSEQIASKWHMAVRRKLLLGEVGWMKRHNLELEHAKRQQQHATNIQNTNAAAHHPTPFPPSALPPHGIPPALMSPLYVPWNVSLRGGIVRLTHGTPKLVTQSDGTTTKKIYPIEAILTVLSPTTNVAEGDASDSGKDGDMEAQWTLVNVDVHVQAKIGQSNHQLDTTNKQRYNLHRICAIAMKREELRARQSQQDVVISGDNDSTIIVPTVATSIPPPARPLNALFHVAHYFSLSWQLEILSSQAVALRKGLWGGTRDGNEPSQRRSFMGASAGNAKNSKSPRRGSTALLSTNNTSSSSSSSLTSSILVTPVKFFDSDTITYGINNNTSRSPVMGVVSISFWSVDDRYGAPALDDLWFPTDRDKKYRSNLEDKQGATMKEKDNPEAEEIKGSAAEKPTQETEAGTIDSKSTPTLSDGGGFGGSSYRSRNENEKSGNDSISTVSRSVAVPPVSNQFTLSIRAEPSAGIIVSLSGAHSIMQCATSFPNSGTDESIEDVASRHDRKTIKELLDATSNPFSLSAAGALLAATKLCAERKCYAIVEVLPAHLPSWVVLKVERGSIAVGAPINYDVIGEDADGVTSGPVMLFRIACDCRTGSFVNTFSRSTPMLQYLACNDFRAGSDLSLLGAAASFSSTRQQSRQAAASFITGRVVRDSFESLTRSMNVLGQRVGLGMDTWTDNNDEHNGMSTMLRRRAVQAASEDVSVSLVQCCGIAAMYGLTSTAISVATGVQPALDLAGGKLEPSELRGFEDQMAPSSTRVGGGSAGSVSSASSSSPSSRLLLTPPISVLIDQRIVESGSSSSGLGGGGGKVDNRLKQSTTNQRLLGVLCSIDIEKGLTLHPAMIQTTKLSMSSGSSNIRTGLQRVKFVGGTASQTEGRQRDFDEGSHPSKRLKLTTAGGDFDTAASGAASAGIGSTQIHVQKDDIIKQKVDAGTSNYEAIGSDTIKAVDMMVEVERLATMISQTLGLND